MVRAATQGFLDSIGLPPYDVRALPTYWQDLPHVWRHVDEIAATFERLFAKSPAWAYKDPVISGSLAAFSEVFKRLQVTPVYAVCVRNPLSVAASANARTGFPLGATLGTWLGLTLRALAGTKGCPRIIVHQPDFVADPRSTLEWLVMAASIPPPTPEQWSKALAAVKPSLVRQKHDRSELDTLPPLVGRTFDLAVRMSQDLANVEAGAYDQEVDDALREFDQWSDMMFGPVAPRTIIGVRAPGSPEAVAEAVLHASGDWQEVALELRAPKGQELALGLIQYPFPVLIKEATWSNGDRTVKADLREGPSATVVKRGGVDCVWPSLGPAQLIVRTPFEGKQTLHLVTVTEATHSRTGRIFAAMSYERDLMRSRFGVSPQVRQPFNEA